MKILFKIIFLFILINNGDNLSAKSIKFEKSIKINVADIAVNNLVFPTATISGTTTACQNAAQPQITFTGLGGTAPYTFTYTITGVAGNQTIATTSGNSVTVSAPTGAVGTFIYSLVNVADSSGTQPQTGSATVTVNSLPVVDFIFNNNQCSGSSMQFSTTSSGNSYTWNFGDGVTSSIKNPSHTFTSLGCGTAPFNVTLTITDSNGCSGTITKTITINQQPDVNFIDNNVTYNPFNTSNQFNNCNSAGANPNYNVNVGPAGTNSNCITSYSVVWQDGGTPQIFTTFPFTHTYTSLGAFKMAVTAIGNNGCSTTKYYTIKNESNPAGGLVSPGSTTNLCAPTPNLQFTLSNWALNSPGTTYSIDYGDSSPLINLLQSDLMQNTLYYNSSNPSLSSNYPVPHIFTTSSCPSPSITATLKISNSCGTTNSTISPIIILSSPIPNFTNPPNACVNSCVQFSNTSIPASNESCNESTLYEWNFGDGSSIYSITAAGNPNPPCHTYTSPGNYTITLTTSGYCGTNIKIGTICIEPPLVPAFTLINSSGCAPQVFTTTNTTVTGNSCIAPTYIWSATFTPSTCGASITAIPTQTTTNASFNFTQPGTYTIKLTAANSCSPPQFVTQVVTVKKPPTATINPIANFCGPAAINPIATVNSCSPAGSPLTYLWNFTGGTPATSTLAVPSAISYTSAGNYTVSLIVTNECGSSTTATESFTINDPPVLTTTPVTQTICSGSTTAVVNLTSSPAGAIFSWTATATTGVSGFTPSGTNTIPTQTISTLNTSPGTVTYSITPSLGGCPGTITNYVITVNPAPTIINQPASSMVCLGGIPTFLSFTVSGVIGTPTYQWYSNIVNNTTSGTVIPGETNATYNPPSTSAGTLYYYCILTLPSGGCSNIKTNSATVTIIANATIITQPTPTQNLCVGVTLPTPLTISYSGGTGTVTFRWYYNTTNSTIGGSLITGASSATYTPQVFTFPGNYYYYATISQNGSGCLPVTSTVAEINVFADPAISSQPIATQTLCQNAPPLNLNVSPTGGNGMFSYQWYSNSTNTNTGGTLIAGVTSSSYNPPTNTVGTKYYYCIISQNSTTGCSATSSTSAIIVISAPTITQPTSSTVCLGGTPTILSITVSGATGTPQYQWYSNTTNVNSGGTAILGETNTTYTPSASTVGITYYYCIITLPSGGCSSITSNTTTVTINAGATINTHPTLTQNLCVGVSISSPLAISYSGGTGAVNYQWYSNTSASNMGGTSISGATNPSYTPGVFTTSGNYYYYVTLSFSGNGCGPISSNAGEIIIVNDPVVILQPAISQTLCQDSAPANLTVSASGGIGTYLYQWFSNSSNSNTGGNLITGETNDTFTPKTNSVGKTYYYCVITQTGSGCNVSSTTAAVVVNLAPTFTSQPVSSTICIGQTPSVLSVSYRNGVGTPFYQWYSNSANTIVGSDPISTAVNATYSPPNSTAGTLYYYCIITLPSGGCSSLTSTIAAVTINPYPLISNKTVIICSGNTFTITPDILGGDIVQIGTTYTWNDPTISPASSITGAVIQTSPQTNISQTLINTTISPATVTFNVTPLSGICPGANFTITVTVNPAISPNVTSTNSTCFGANNGTLQTSITDGTPFTSGAPYLVSWTGPNGFSSSTSSISNLTPGSYNLSINDAGGCPINQTYLIKEPDDTIIITDLEKDIICFNDASGAIKITITGGGLNYSYAWTKNGTAHATTEDLSNLSPGIYVVSVSDGNNCGPKMATFTITEPPILTINLVNQTNILCFGQPTGAITINVVGGTSPYTYAWTGPNGFTSSNQNLTGAFAGTYNVLVNDNSGCTKNLTVLLTQIPEISIVPTTTPIICYGNNNASIVIAVTGGLAPYQIVWSNLGSGTFQDNLSAGDYLITVTDASNCIKTLNVNIPEAPIFTINPVLKNISCFGTHDGSINLNIIGGVTPVKLVWDDNAVAGNVRNNLGPGSYTVTITDSKPCTIVRTFIILEPQPLILSANVTNAFDCENANSGAINLLVAGGTPPFTYKWSNGATSEDLTNISAGNYSITVIDSRGCSKQAQYSINRPPPIVIGVITKTEFDCETKYVKQSFVAQISGGVPPYQLAWSSGTVSGSNNELMNTSQDGTAILFVTDALGCKADYSFNVKLLSLGTPSYNATSYSYLTYGTYSIKDPIEFTNTATGDYISMFWDFGDGSFSTELNPLHAFINPKEYVVTQTVTYPFGCIYVQKSTFIVEKGYVLVVPNAFTPNNDNINDTFRPVTKALKNVQLDIYDTLGSLIYSETGDVLKGWDGKIKGPNAENGNYYCKVSAETFYGTIVNENHPFVLIK